MNIQFKSLSIQNFRSIQKADLVFTPGLHIIVGHNQVEEFTLSNGAGKSTLIPCALPYALFGRFLTPDGKIMRSGFKRRNSDSEPCNVILKLMRDDREVSITRGRRGTKPFLKVEGFDTPIKGDQELSQIVGCDFNTLTSLLVLTRASVEGGLFYGTDTKRKEFFLSLAGMDKMIDEAVDLVKNFKSIYSLESLELKTVYDVENRVGDVSQEMNRIVISIHNYELKEIETRDAIVGFKSTLESFTLQRVSLEESIKQNEDKLLQLDEINKQFSALSQLYEQRGELVATLNYASTKITEIDRQVAGFKKLSGGKCPTCQQDVTNEYVSSICSKLVEMSAYLNIQYTQKNAELVSLKEQIAGVENLKARTAQIIIDLRWKIKRDQDAKDSTDKSISQVMSDYKVNHERLSTYESTLIDLRGQLSELQALQFKRQDRLVQIHKDYTCFYNLEQACSSWLVFLKQTLPAYALSEMTAFMSTFTDRCLKSLWDSNVSLKVFFDKASEDLSVTICDKNGEETPIGTLSAGEQARIFLSLALGSIIATRSFRGWHSNLFVLDEVFDMLDRIGREVVYGLLHEMAKQFNLCTYVISHHEPPSNAESIYMMVKTDKGSVLEIQ